MTQMGANNRRSNVSTCARLVASRPQAHTFKGGQNIWAKMWFGALGCAVFPLPLTPSPAPLIPPHAGGCGRRRTGRTRRRQTSPRTWALPALKHTRGLRVYAASPSRVFQNIRHSGNGRCKHETQRLQHSRTKVFTGAPPALLKG